MRVLSEVDCFQVLVQSARGTMSLTHTHKYTHTDIHTHKQEPKEHPLAPSFHEITLAVVDVKRRLVSRCFERLSKQCFNLSLPEGEAFCSMHWFFFF